MKLGSLLLFAPVAIWMMTDGASKPATKPANYKPPGGTPPPIGTGAGASMPTGAVMKQLFENEGITSFPMPAGTKRPRIGPSNAAKREDLILGAVKAGKADFVWDEVLAWGNGYEAKVPVFADALKIEGVRVNANMATAQLIADSLGVVMMTPKVADAIYEQAATRFAPKPQANWVKDGSMADADRMVEYGGPGGYIDQAIAKAYKTGVNAIVNNAGKYWVLAQGLWQRPDHSANYGWHCTAQDPGCKDSAVTPWLQNPPSYMVQGVPIGDGHYTGSSTFHTLPHTDYSQVLRYIGPTIKIRVANSPDDWQEISTAKVLTDPTFAPILSNEGALPAARHPGVPPKAAVA